MQAAGFSNIPPVHYNEQLNAQNYRLFGLSKNVGRNQGVKTADSNIRQSKNFRFFDDERSIRMPMHPLVDHAERLVCSQNLKRRNMRFVETQMHSKTDWWRQHFNDSGHSNAAAPLRNSMHDGRIKNLCTPVVSRLALYKRAPRSPESRRPISPAN